jgi:hypothetical protein
MGGRVYLAMPRYGPQANFEGVVSLLLAAEESEDALRIHIGSEASSALTFTFNSLWCKALALYAAGEIDYFAMQHDDVVPPHGWLDMLHADHLASGADVVAAVAPIKDGRGLCSTAVDDTGDPWRVRRLTMKQVHALPEVFTDADVGGELLLNTGLWICKLGPWCLEQNPDGSLRFAFTIYNKIIRLPDGTFGVRFISEDWDASRQFRRIGLKLACSRRVVLSHWGSASWSSGNVWGWDHDQQNAPGRSRVRAGPGATGPRAGPRNRADPRPRRGTARRPAGESQWQRNPTARSACSRPIGGVRRAR